MFFNPVVILYHFQGVNEVGRVWLVRSDVLRRQYLIKREPPRLELLSCKRERGPIDVGEDDEFVVFREFAQGVCGVGEQRPVFYGSTERNAFLLRGVDCFQGSDPVVTETRQEGLRTHPSGLERGARRHERGCQSRAFWDAPFGASTRWNRAGSGFAHEMAFRQVGILRVGGHCTFPFPSPVAREGELKTRHGGRRSNGRIGFHRRQRSKP